MSNKQEIKNSDVCTAVTPNTVGAVEAIIENNGEAVGLVVVVDRNTGEMFDAIVTQAEKENHMKLAALIPRQNTHEFAVLTKEEYAELRIKEMHVQAANGGIRYTCEELQNDAKLREADLRSQLPDDMPDEIKDIIVKAVLDGDEAAEKKAQKQIELQALKAMPRDRMFKA